MAARSRNWLARRFHLGLRDRVALGFGLMALGLSVVLAIVTWVLVSGYLMQQRERSAQVEVEDNLNALQRSLHDGRSEIPVLLDSLPTSDRSASLLSYGGQWYATSLSQGPASLPPDLIGLVTSGTAAKQRIDRDSGPVLVIGLPLRQGRGAYFELFSLAELDRTYRVLSITLIAGALATSLLGLVVGWLASARALRPLADVTEAAGAIARGNLDARLRREDDPDLGALARSFNQTAESLQRRVRADARFAGNVSHELRTPLTTMLNSLELLQNRADELPASMREPLEMLSVELERFRRLVVDLLEISRDDGGDRHPGEKVMIADLVRRAADAAAGRPVTYVDEPALGIAMNADKRRLERTVANLVENAETHGGGCVVVSVQRLPTAIRVEVDDSGPGVLPERREYVFERFTREAPGDEPGVGLGLAIVAQHVRWHGGSVVVEDRPGGGARFVVELPMNGMGHDRR